MWFWSRKPGLMDHARQLADYFSLLPGIENVCLAGSLARSEDRAHAHDIDLVLLHDGTLPDSGGFSLQREETLPYSYGSPSWVFTGGHALTCLFRLRAGPIIRYLRTCVPEKVDIICVQKTVLGSCEYLHEISSNPQLEYDPDFFRRIFCEVLLLEFDPVRGNFLYRVRHGDGLCCRPKRTWVDVKRDREHARRDVRMLQGLDEYWPGDNRA